MNPDHARSMLDAIVERDYCGWPLCRRDYSVRRLAGCTPWNPTTAWPLCDEHARRAIECMEALTEDDNRKETP